MHAWLWIENKPAGFQKYKNINPPITWNMKESIKVIFFGLDTAHDKINENTKYNPTIQVCAKNRERERVI